jgi:hypothetical protein
MSCLIINLIIQTGNKINRSLLCKNFLSIWPTVWLKDALVGLLTDFSYGGEGTYSAEPNRV